MDYRPFSDISSASLNSMSFNISKYNFFSCKQARCRKNKTTTKTKSIIYNRNSVSIFVIFRILGMFKISEPPPKNIISLHINELLNSEGFDFAKPDNVSDNVDENFVEFTL